VIDPEVKVEINPRIFRIAISYSTMEHDRVHFFFLTSQVTARPSTGCFCQWSSSEARRKRCHDGDGTLLPDLGV
jgi:hypothetical protein